MKQLDDCIFDVITKLWSNKRQPNENSVYNHILKAAELLTAIQLEAGADSAFLIRGRGDGGGRGGDLIQKFSCEILGHYSKEKNPL